MTRPLSAAPAEVGCPFCGGATAVFGAGVVLLRHPATYRCCDVCGSVFVPEPTWLDEAYSSAITALDTGLLERCLQLANVTGSIIAAEGLKGGSFLDFAGGYGTLTRLMRDRGYDFRHHDPLCDNLFAVGHAEDVAGPYALVTAVEVLEHLPDPARQLAEAAAASDVLIVTTQVLPTPAPQPGGWDYYAQETGQHITFATLKGLEALARTWGMKLTSSGRLIHVFHRRPLRARTRALLRREPIAYGVGAVLGEWQRRRGLALTDSRAAARSLEPPAS
jgi:hypothetical protein